VPRAFPFVATTIATPKNIARPRATIKPIENKENLHKMQGILWKQGKRA
jgi:hypothetical protein